MPVSSPSPHCQVVGRVDSQLGLTGLDATIWTLFSSGLAPSTRTMYSAAVRRYTSFCGSHNMMAFPLSEYVLCCFVAHLFSSSVAPRSIRSYLSALRYYQVALLLPDPLLSTMPRLTYVLRGAQRCQQWRGTHSRLPVTPNILWAIYRLWSHLGVSYDRVMLWAAFCLAFFGFLRAGEFTCPSTSAFTSRMLARADISVDSRENPSYLTVLLRQIKTDLFSNGVTIHLHRIDDVLCPVAVVLAYLAIRPPEPGPLFLFRNGSTLSRPRLFSHAA